MTSERREFADPITGIDVYAFGKPVTICDNYVETETGVGIRLDGGKSAIISDNVVICHKGTAIKVVKSTGTKISDNKEGEDKWESWLQASWSEFSL